MTFDTRAVKAKEELRTARELVQVVSDQDDAISSEMNVLKEDLEKLQRRVDR